MLKCTINECPIPAVWQGIWTGLSSSRQGLVTCYCQEHIGIHRSSMTDVKLLVTLEQIEKELWDA